MHLNLCVGVCVGYVCRGVCVCAIIAQCFHDEAKIPNRIEYLGFLYDVNTDVKSRSTGTSLVWI